MSTMAYDSFKSEPLGIETICKYIEEKEHLSPNLTIYCLRSNEELIKDNELKDDNPSERLLSTNYENINKLKENYRDLLNNYFRNNLIIETLNFDELLEQLRPVVSRLLDDKYINERKIRQRR